MIAEIQSELKRQHKAREQLATRQVHLYGLSIHSVFHSSFARILQGEDGLRKQSVQLSNLEILFFSHKENKKFFNSELSCCSLQGGGGVEGWEIHIARGMLCYYHTCHEPFIPVGMSPAVNSAGFPIFQVLVPWLWGSSAKPLYPLLL